MDLKQTEALKLALEALKGGLWDYGPEQDEHQRCNEVIAICEAALAEQPAQQLHCDDCGGFDPECPLEHPEQGCEFCSHSLYAGTKCKNCGREQPARQPIDVDALGIPHGQPFQPEQQQEPVVWMYVNRSTHETVFQKHMRSFVDHSQWKEVPLYGEPLANHELRCVCGAVWCGDEMVHLPDKRPPASKPWVGLSTGELDEIDAPIRERGHATIAEIYRSIEAKLKDKNGY